MLIHSTYKAFLITVLLFSILALGLFNIYLQGEKEESQFSVAYYFEEIEEETMEAEQTEDLEELETHRAYNEAREQIIKAEQNFEELQEDFEQKMQAMEDALKNANKEPILPEEISIETYSQTEEVIHNDNVKRISSVRYYLVDRNAIYLPNPVYTCPKAGVIVINITVNNLGKVIHTHVDNLKSNTSDKCLIEQALEYANQAKFDVSESLNEKQKGSITYRFIGSQ